MKRTAKNIFVAPGILAALILSSCIAVEFFKGVLQ